MYEIILYTLLVASILLLFFMRKKAEQEENAEETEEKKIEKSFFIDYGSVKWHLIYTTDATNTDNYIIENIPYCKKCSIKYSCIPDNLKQDIHLTCSKCRDKKRSYPLTLNYHTVQNIAEEKIAELRKQFLPGR